ncbi:MAG: MoxR family ATPase [Desulfobacterales bacterium]|jgi:MoxR-like ATPase|nr:MoxR family ATPase [Desulfobacterales bacterium]
MKPSSSDLKPDVDSRKESLLHVYARKVNEAREEIAKVIIGQREMVDLMIYTLLSKGHILLEGVPGLAKSLAVETFARVVGGEFRRFQFTPDKMPTDITGSLIYNEKDKRFDFFFGPVFCNIFLADEINRASPKVQSALLQAMQEREVTVECERHRIPNPFMVLATQNPIEQIGTYPLAEAQIDRFMVKYNVGYPGQDEELELARRKHSNFETLKAGVRTILNPDEIRDMQAFIHEQVTVTDTVMKYIINICVATRPPESYHQQRLSSDLYHYIRLGASPRATEFLLALSKTLAFCEGRNTVGFDDVNACAVHVLRHRILLNSTAISQQITAEMIVSEVLRMVRAF